MQDMLIVDADGHLRDLVDNCYRPYLEPPFNDRAIFWPSDGFDRNKNGRLGVRDVDAPKQLHDMDVEGIDISILYPTTGLAIGKIYEPDYAVALCRAYNNWVHDYCATDPRRLKAVALLPLQDVDAAVRELHRAVVDLGLVGGMLPTFVRRGPALGDRALWPLYAEAEKLDVPVGAHATGGETDSEGRFASFLAVHICSHVPEQMIALTNVVLGGVFEQFPRLRYGFLEAGCGWVPFWMEHMDEEWEKRPDEAPLCKEKPSTYIKSGRCYFGCEPEEKTMPFAAQYVGEDVLLYASDYPHWDSDWPHTVKTVRERTDMTDQLKRKVLADNALRFYGLKAAVPA
jgi:predicted TIM-barrel fold metal-dependent hydrolase